MGIDRNYADFLLGARKGGADFRQTAMLLQCPPPTIAGAQQEAPGQKVGHTVDIRVIDLTRAHLWGGQ